MLVTLVTLSRKKTSIEVELNSKDNITLAVSSNNTISKKQSLVAQLVRVLH